jgi:hypothetical protein
MRRAANRIPKPRHALKVWAMFAGATYVTILMLCGEINSILLRSSRAKAPARRLRRNVPVWTQFVMFRNRPGTIVQEASRSTLFYTGRVTLKSGSPADVSVSAGFSF